MICQCVSYIVQGPSFRGEPCFIICRCNCTCNSFISYNSCNKEVWSADAFISLYHTTHRMLTVPHSDAALNLGFYGDNSCHYGIEIELEVSDMLVLLDLWAINHELQKYYVITIDPTVPNGLEFVSAPMTFYYHYTYTKMLYEWFNMIKDVVTVKSSDNTGTHFHISSNKISPFNFEWLKQYMLSNDIDLLAGRKENTYCRRGHDTVIKYSAIHMCKNTVEIRIFKSFEQFEELIKRLYIFEKIIYSQ